MKRKLKQEEKILIKNMLAGTVWTKFIDQLDFLYVKEMTDSGMGSLKFINKNEEPRRLGTVISEAEFLDKDGILVTVTLNLDQHNELYELDLWKVDFSALISLDNARNIKI